MQTMTKPRELNRQQVVDALLAAKLCKRAQAYKTVLTIPHRLVAGHLIYRSDVVEAWVAANVRSSE